MHTTFSMKHFLAARDLDGVSRLHNYTENCEDKYVLFAREIGRVSLAVAELRDSARHAPWQREWAADAADVVEAADPEVPFPDYERKAVDGFARRTRHYAQDATGSLNYFAASVPHHVRKIEHLASSCDKSFRELKNGKPSHSRPRQRSDQAFVRNKLAQSVFVKEHIGLMDAYRELHFRREVVALHQVRLYTAQQRSLATLLHNIARKMRKDLRRERAQGPRVGEQQHHHHHPDHHHHHPQQQQQQQQPPRGILHHQQPRRWPYDDGHARAVRASAQAHRLTAIERLRAQRRRHGGAE